jgi:hypothetical protein
VENTEIKTPRCQSQFSFGSVATYVDSGRTLHISEKLTLGALCSKITKHLFRPGRVRTLDTSLPQSVADVEIAFCTSDLPNWRLWRLRTHVQFFDRGH